MFQPQHVPTGLICGKCGLHASKHRAPDSRPHAERRRYHQSREQERERAPNQDRIVGIDGEGVGRRPHRYTFLAAHDEQAAKWSVSSDDTKVGRLSTAQCLDFILAIPERTLIVGYAFLYDITKILTDLPNEAIWLLVKDEGAKKRARIVDGRVIYRPVYWKGYALNYMNRRLSVGRWRWETKQGKRGPYKRPVIYQRRTVWDIFAFYQSKFTSALLDWKVADATRLKRMAEMKDKRNEFDKLETKDIEAYCIEECAYLAKLARALLDAHNNAGLSLKHYYGAGSTASVFLEKIGAKELRGDIPEPMRGAVASAFFGGRFENSVIGPVYGRCFNYDISSAYPYQATFLPCLLCGRWEHVERPSSTLLGSSNLALIRWTIPKITPAPWGTLPVRSKDGTIAFPLAGKGGWVWKEEFNAAQRLNPHLQALEAWTYTTDCEHRPFKDVPQYYRERVRLGKEGRGIVLKLGTNSIYGKLAQSRGLNPPYQSWVWAGNITSGTRAQLLNGLYAHKDRANCLMFATDGIWSRERLTLDEGRDTGTNDLAKPLGGWEEKIFEEGVFCVRPGIYFPLNPTKDALKEVRARGLGKKVLYEQWPRILDAWERKAESIEVSGLTRFVGAKSAITYGANSGYTRSPNYGEWVDHKIQVSFNPYPKRKSVRADGSLEPWGYFDWESVPYDPATKSPEAVMLALAELIALEQPDGTFADADSSEL